MSNRKMLLGALAAAALTCLGAAAHADTAVVDLSGFLAADDFGYDPNSYVFVNLPAGALVTGFSYSNLTFTTDPSDYSWLSDLVISVNNVEGNSVTDWLDWKPSTIDAPGTAGPLSGSWNGAIGAEGPYGAGGPFTVSADGTLFVTTYLDVYYPSAGITIGSGTLSIQYTVAAVPEPSTYGLMAAGLLAVAALARRRR